MRHFLIATAIALLSASGALAQNADTAQIIVSGSGEAEAPADWAEVSVMLVGEGPTSVAAIKALTAKQSLLEARMMSLTKTSSVRIETGELAVQAVRATDCEDGESYRPNPVLSEGACAIKGYSASMKIEVRVSPASEAGNVASLASELGAMSSSLSGYGLHKPDALREQATRDAIESARLQAMTIARASNVRLGPIVRIQAPGGYSGGELYEDEAAPAAGAAAAPRPAQMVRAPPTATVAISPPPVKAMVRLTVIYSVLP